MNLIPTRREEKVVADAKDLIVRRLSKIPDIEIRFVGSVEKGTWLSGSYDLDVFVLCDDPEAMFHQVDDALGVDMAYTKPERIHAGDLLIYRTNLPVGNSGFDDVKTDIVLVEPDFDRVQTIQHAYFYRDNLSAEQKQRVRRLKGYFKTLGLYGAEQGGITGVAIEELVRLHDSDESILRILEDPEYPFLQDPRVERDRNLLASIIPFRKHQFREMLRKTREVFENIDTLFYPFNEGMFRERYLSYRHLQFGREADVAHDFSKTLRAVNRAYKELGQEIADLYVDFDIFVAHDRIRIAYQVTPRKVPEIITKECTSTTKQAEEMFLKAFPEAYRIGENLFYDVERDMDKYHSNITAEVYEARLVKVMEEYDFRQRW